MILYETERLILRQVDDSFAQQVLAYYERNRDFLTEWEAQKPAEFYTIDVQRLNLRRDIEIFARGDSLKLWIFKKVDNDYSNVIGCITFSLITRGIFQSCFVGYKLDQGQLNQGFVTEALRKAIEVMFKDFGLHRIEAPIMPRNKASIKVAEKLGFENEGLSRKMLKVNGIWEDHIRWVLLNEHEQE
ncbi:GNAT family N-acetyltransferase [Bacillus solimangrovi]|uniref:Alanine acetyltransferase n=1 Tax=Bacillus solimangrovi TaxID=1305675 RepID=A0A1E5LJB8_9BACI|nr:GNAT family N-acetyltransferase [Bacillus solimangrovi]OEH94180.1 alanine acetyltransferase [Bacillus solimangrovi]